MIRALVESPVVAWPVALSFASIALGDRLWRARRRMALNRSLHELRRPLQAMTLAGAADGRGQLERAIDALALLDREINGGTPPGRRRVDVRGLAEAAVGRWRGAALGAGRTLGFVWRGGPSEVICDPAAISRALDNLIANAIEHGSGPIRIEGSRRPGFVRLHVANRSATAGPPAATSAAQRRRDPRRGHGLGVVSAVAAEHGGRFAACRHRAGASAVLELPLAP
jgi:two-component system OmpR family sensor kinase